MVKMIYFIVGFTLLLGVQMGEMMKIDYYDCKELPTVFNEVNLESKYLSPRLTTGIHAENSILNQSKCSSNLKFILKCSFHLSFHTFHILFHYSFLMSFLSFCCK
jgi:hypothetical protein